MKKIPRILVRVTVSNGKHDKRLCTSIRKAVGNRTGVRWKEKKRENRSANENNGRYVPLLVTVNEPRRNCADVRASTNE